MSLLEQKTRIWRQGQTTNPFVCPQLSFSKSKRFKLYSIYWPQKSFSKGFTRQTKTPKDLQAYKISKMIDEQEKNQSRMSKGPLISQRNEGSFTSRSQPRNGFSNFKPARTSSLSRENQQIVERLAKTSDLKQSKYRDRNGNRTNLLQNQQEDLFYSTLKQQKKFRGTETGFYTSRRINLNLPDNYYPGPGSYEIKRYLEQKFRLEKRQKNENSSGSNSKIKAKSEHQIPKIVGL